jgi:predicted N-acetyltransferase YhbS
MPIDTVKADTAQADTVTREPDGLERWWLSVAERTAANLRGSLRLEIYAAPGARTDLPGVFPCTDVFIKEVQEFRAEVFFAAGRRPSFRQEDGSFADDAATDGHAYHIVCRDEQGSLTGYLRADLSDLGPQSSVVHHLGAERTEVVLRELDVSRGQVLEMGRLAVSATSRWLGIAEALVVSTHALACRLGCVILWCTAAEGDGQKHYFVRYGATELPGSSAYVPKYSDSACVVVQDLRVTLPRIQGAVRTVDEAVFDAADGVGGQKKEV